MFPDSSIVKNYCQGCGKVKYVIQFGISPYIKKLVKRELQGQPFACHFDEATNSQVKTQYDGYATYLIPKYSEISSAYCGSLYAGKCTNDDIMVHFHKFMKIAVLNSNFMLTVGMEGPNVNLLFKNKLEEEFSIIEVGTFVRLLKLPIFNKCKGKLDNVHTCLHDVGKSENFCLGNFLTFVCIFFCAGLSNLYVNISLLVFKSTGSGQGVN